MNDEVLIRAEGVSKKYCRSLKRSMRYGIADIVRDTFNLPPSGVKLRPDEFWALKDVSFEVRRGECLGLIGPNGAGKSTLLKLINGIFLPDTGMIARQGRVGALIEVGAGFHPLLTGMENIYINGAILGLSRKEIRNRLDEIIAFSGLERFIDSPVKHYSSGMYARLGFSIAAHLSPDILLIDEILAVGDMAFAIKCYNHISKLITEGSAVILVSHQLEQIQNICSSCILISNSKISAAGHPSECIASYNASMYKQAGAGTSLLRNGDNVGIIKEFEITSGNIKTRTIQPNAPLEFSLIVNTGNLKLSNTQFEVRVWHNNEIILTLATDNLKNWKSEISGERHIRMNIQSLPFTPGTYTLAFGLISTDRKRYIDWFPRRLSLHIEGLRKRPGILNTNYDVITNSPIST
ncbi:MAG: ABC transporter ATP-binding protein [Sedimenticola sp.]